MPIVSIAEHPDLIEIVADWQFTEWGQRDEHDSLLTHIVDLSRQAENRPSVATTFIAIEGNEPVGCASIVEQSEEVYRASPRQRNLSPWLASVYVTPQARRRGIATALVSHATAHAASQGIQRLYLFTDGAQGLYGRLGWTVFGTDTYGGLTMTIMMIDLSSPHH